MCVTKIYFNSSFVCHLLVGADVATVAASTAVTSLIIGFLIGAMLTHLIHRLRKKTHKFSTSNVYERPDFKQISNLSEVERSGEGQYAELKVGEEQQRKTSDVDVSPYINCQF